jgi:sirohydrochlorin ferrochelatase
MSGPAKEVNKKVVSKALKKAILLVDHGSRLSEANEMLSKVAELVARECPRYHVEFSHMELAEPTIDQGFEACVRWGAVDITIHPYMLSPGRHATRDIPRMVSEAAVKHPGVTYRVTEPLSLHPLMAKVILERVKKAEKTKASGQRRESKKDRRAHHAASPRSRPR